jgi:hypothetical protein
MVSVIRFTFRTSEAIAADLAGDAAVAFLFPHKLAGMFVILGQVSIDRLLLELFPFVFHGHLIRPFRQHED